MMNLSVRLLIFIGFFSAGTPAFGKCSDYERQVFAMIVRAQAFQETERFQEYGWSRVKAGPTNGWLDDFHAIRDSASREEALAFFQKYGFTLTEVFQVADEHRTEGHLDSFYQGVSDDIENAQRCDKK